MTANFLTYTGWLPRRLRAWADRIIQRAVSGIEAWETAHDWDEEEASEE